MINCKGNLICKYFTDFPVRKNLQDGDYYDIGFSFPINLVIFFLSILFKFSTNKSKQQ